MDDVKKLYKEEFDEAKEEYNLKQVRGDRKIKDYFTHISNNEKNDLACEIIIELGDKKYWDTKDDKFKRRMTNVYKKQILFITGGMNYYGKEQISRQLSGYRYQTNHRRT